MDKSTRLALRAIMMGLDEGGGVDRRSLRTIIWHLNAMAKSTQVDPAEADELRALADEIATDTELGD
jgi:hypothetical protein